MRFFGTRDGAVAPATRCAHPPLSAEEGGPCVRRSRERGNATDQDAADVATPPDAALPTPHSLRGLPSPAEWGGKARLVLPALAACAALAGCTVGPDYSRPSVETPLAYKQGGLREDSPAYVAARSKGWREARPNDAAERGDWWRVFNDPTLDRLIRLVDVDNQSLRQAVANYRQARALVASAQAALYPTVIGAPSITRSGSGGTARTSVSLLAQASWELDLFGGVRRNIESETALAQSDAATIALTRLAIQAEVAANYLSVRYADALRQVLDANVENFRKTAAITENQYAAGVAARSDVITAQTQVQTIQAQAIAIRLTRVQFENAIATLIGRPPSEVSIPAAGIRRDPPAVPVGIPSDLLERRPDVAQAERLVQSQSERIGVAVAAFFPTVTISATGGISGLTRGGLFQAANQVWSVTAAGSETLFDGGARTAALRASEAAYDAAVANYRQVVLAAFSEVENQMAAVRILREQQGAQDQAVELSRKAVEITLNEYRAGTQNFTTVVTAQGLLVTNEIAALQVRLNRFTAAVTLIRALGGGWDARSLPSDTELKGPSLPIDRGGQAVRPDE